MSQLLIRNLDDEIVDAVKRQAAANGRSTEAELREILRSQLASRPKQRSFKEALAEMPYFEDDDLLDVR